MYILQSRVLGLCRFSKRQSSGRSDERANRWKYIPYSTLTGGNSFVVHLSSPSALMVASFGVETIPFLCVPSAHRSALSKGLVLDILGLPLRTHSLRLYTLSSSTTSTGSLTLWFLVGLAMGCSSRR